MTPKQRDDLLRWLPLFGTILTIGIAWGLLTAAVEQKADRSDYNRLEAVINRLENKLDAVVRIECRRDPKDSICPYK